MSKGIMYGIRKGNFFHSIIKRLIKYSVLCIFDEACKEGYYYGLFGSDLSTSSPYPNVEPERGQIIFPKNDLAEKIDLVLKELNLEYDNRPRLK